MQLLRPAIPLYFYSCIFVITLCARILAYFITSEKNGDFRVQALTKRSALGLQFLPRVLSIIFHDTTAPNNYNDYS